MRLRALALLLPALLVASACDDNLGLTPESTGVLGVIEHDRDFTQLHALLEGSALADVLAGAGPYTVFAPTDNAFYYLGGETNEALLSPQNQATLDRILRYHVVPGHYAPSDLTDGLVLETLDGVALSVRREGQAVFVGEARVLDGIEEVSNGVVYPVSTLLRSNLDLRERLLVTPIVRDYVNLLDATELLPDLGGTEPFTVLAPVDDAFAQLGAPGVSLLYSSTNRDVATSLARAHVVTGLVDLAGLPSGTTLETGTGAPVVVTNENGVLYVSGRRVLSPAIPTTNGVLYLLDRLLLTAINVDANLRVSPSLSSFTEEARSIPDLRARLQGDEEHTVFAFTNTTYSTTQLAVRNALHFDENAALHARLMRTHVVAGRYALADLEDGQVLESLEGTPLHVTRQNGVVRINQQPIQMEQAAANGVIHHLGGLLYPESDVFDWAILSGFVDYSQAIRRAGLEDVLRSTDPITAFGFPDAVFDSIPDLIFRPELAEIFRFHLTNEKIPGLIDGLAFTTLNGAERLMTYVVDPKGEDYWMLDSLHVIGYTRKATNGHLFFIAYTE